MEVALPLAPHLFLMNRNTSLDVSEALREKAKVRPRLFRKLLSRPVFVFMYRFLDLFLLTLLLCHPTLHASHRLLSYSLALIG
jgi:hypothetical protein